MSDWVYNDPSISDDELMYRRVPNNDDFWTYDPVRRTHRVNPKAFQREPNQGCSVHLDSVLRQRNRAPDTIYPAITGIVQITVSVPRKDKAGVLQTFDPDEPDPDLAAAHAEIRPPQPQRDRLFWRPISNALAASSVWVRMPALLNAVT
jgi:hypothetical protein